MTRIVAGTARGRRLTVPPALTRPTSDRVREALFSSLEAIIELSGARVLDLFAGSGALGLEALSRGAAEAVLVDSSPAVAKVMTQNVAALGLPGARVDRRSAQDFLRRDPREFDLVLMDPPYDLPGDAVEALLATLSRGWLAAHAVVVVERGQADSDLAWPHGFGSSWNRRFGSTRLLRAVWYGHDQGPS